MIKLIDAMKTKDFVQAADAAPTAEAETQPKVHASPMKQALAAASQKPALESADINMDALLDEVDKLDPEGVVVVDKTTEDATANEQKAEAAAEPPTKKARTETKNPPDAPAAPVPTLPPTGRGRGRAKPQPAPKPTPAGRGRGRGAAK